jgi:hypothetical protein
MPGAEGEEELVVVEVWGGDAWLLDAVVAGRD